MSFEAVALTHRGRIRPANEDGIAVDGHIITDAPLQCFNLDGNIHILALADGMGGHNEGARASLAALTFLSEQPPHKLATSVSCATVIRSANDHIYNLAKEMPDSIGMGTTIVGVGLKKSSICVFNIGDSRSYLHAPGHLIQLSVDDVPPVTINVSRRAAPHAITHSLGGASRYTSVNPHVSEMPSLVVDESIILCSDGLTDMLPDSVICQTLDNCRSIAAGVLELDRLAMKAGGRDNIAIVAVRIQRR